MAECLRDIVALALAPNMRLLSQIVAAVAQA